MLAADPIRRAYDRARTSLDVLDHPVANGLIVVSQIELGDRFAVTGVGPHHFVGEITTPITFALAPVFNFGPTTVLALVFLARVASTRSTGAARSATISDAGLSSRSPLNAPARILPSLVHPANSI